MSVLPTSATDSSEDTSHRLSELTSVLTAVRRRLRSVYERHLERTIDRTPDHIAVIQDGNRRYADKQGADATDGHRAGAQTTENLLRWCQQFEISEVTLYAFSTENFKRPPEEREAIFDLIAEKLREFADADAVQENRVRIKAIGDRKRLPDRVQAAIAYAERRTAGHDQFTLNVALAYGGRATLLSAARAIAADAATGELSPDAIDVTTVADYLYEEPIQDVDLIIRTGGDRRTSNFLPWHANGNEAAVYFCTPYWPAFSRIDFLRGLRTYQHREQSWRQTRAQRAVALLRALGDVELQHARQILKRHGDALPGIDGGDRSLETRVEPEDAPRQK